MPLAPDRVADVAPRDAAARNLANRQIGIATLVVVGLAAAHIFHVWGYSGGPLGDHSRWLGETERMARGQQPYLDFVWTFPPLPIWMLGSVAKLVGPEARYVWAFASGLTLLLFVVYVQLLRALLDRSTILPTAVATFFLATGAACFSSVPLPLGMYTPGALIGPLFLLLALAIGLHNWETPRLWSTSAVGLLAGACIIAKQDVWAPAMFLVAVAASVLIRSPNASTRRSVFVLFLAFLLPIGVALGTILPVGGFANLGQVLLGYGLATELWARSYPSWERLTVEVIASSFILALVGGLTAEARRPAWRRFGWMALGCGAIATIGFLVMSVRTTVQVTAHGLPPSPTTSEQFLLSYVTRFHNSPLRASTSWLLYEIQLHVLPILLPLFVLGLVLAQWRRLESGRTRNMVLFLLLLCLAARARRLFEHVDWYQVLLEVPTYVLALQLLAGRDAPIRGIHRLLKLFALIGLAIYWYFVPGHFTRHGALDRANTARGQPRWPRADAAQFAQIAAAMDRRDPDHHRPLLAYPRSEGFNYWLSRPNPTRYTNGFHISDRSPSQILADLRAQRDSLFLLDVPRLGDLDMQPKVGLEIAHWEPRPVPSFFSRIDRPLFEEFLRQCGLIDTFERPPGRTAYLYDCSHPAGQP